MKIDYLPTNDFNLKDSHTLVLGVFESKSLDIATTSNITRELKIDLKELVKKIQFEGVFGQTISVDLFQKHQPNKLILLGLGDKHDFIGDKIRKAGAKVLGLATKGSPTYFAMTKNKTLEENTYQLLAEGMHLAAYQFTKYKSDKTQLKPKITIVGDVDSDEAKKSLERAHIAATGVCHARDLINEPPSKMYPIKIAEAAKELCGELNLKIDILGKKELEHENMHLLLAVAQGAGDKNPAQLIKISYRPEKKSKEHIALVGKGVTFDSGGLSLKPGPDMISMKCDMAGAACVFGAMWTLAQLKPNVAVTGYLGCAENCIGSNAYHLGDVIRSKKGTTIEITNTDAEGRLVLADTLTYAQADCAPTIIIDVATLTGACKVALGPNYAGLFSNDNKLSKQIIESGQASGEAFWPMPLDPALKTQLDSSIADMKNSGDRWGGAIIAALFLKEFIEKNVKWAHMDIAGTAYNAEPSGYNPKDGVGFGVRTLVHFVMNR